MKQLTNSLFARLISISLVLFALLFGSLDYVIGQLSQRQMLAAKSVELGLQNLLLLTAASISEQGVNLPSPPKEQRLNTLDSNLTAFITLGDGSVSWRSASAINSGINPALLTKASPQPGAKRLYYRDGYFVHAYTVSWELVEDHPETIGFFIIENAASSEAELQEFRRSVRTGLLITAFLFIGCMLAAYRWSARPLDRLATDIKKIEHGDSHRLDDDYPVELAPLANNINTLIEAEKQQRERFRMTLADLAHSLKTPLAVIHNELSTKQPDQQQLARQATRMNDIIQHQLQRAVLQNSQQLGEGHCIDKPIRELCSALPKVYPEKALSISTDYNPDIAFRGDPHDLMEILGNILDNACKACKQTVMISAREHHSGLVIEIHDDGPGISTEKQQQVLQRGQRLDSQQPGQGIGLDIVCDIVRSYAGEIEISSSPLGGALFRVTLP